MPSAAALIAALYSCSPGLTLCLYAWNSLSASFGWWRRTWASMAAQTRWESSPALPSWLSSQICHSRWQGKADEGRTKATGPGGGPEAHGREKKYKGLRHKELQGRRKRGGRDVKKKRLLASLHLLPGK